MFGWLRRPKPKIVPAMAFDAVVDLGPSVRIGLTVEHAMLAAARAIETIPGARRVRVRPFDGPAAITVRVFPAGRAVEREGKAWAALRGQVQGAAMAALAGPAPPQLAPAPAPASVPTLARRVWSPPDPVTAPAPQGFAEAPGQADALASLEALAQSVRAAPIQRSARHRPPRRAKPAANDIAALARLLGFVLPGEDRSTAAAAIRRFGSYAAVLAAPESELRAVPGLGPHSVAAIKLIHEAAIRLARAGVAAQPVLDDPARLHAYLAAAQARARVEQFRVLFLDPRGMLKSDEVQASGTVNHTPVYPREVVRRALELGAAAIVLVHNHPSGDPTPSRDDVDMTRQIADAAAALGLVVRDHVIVGNGRSFSFAEAGML